jgi:acyl-CoA thioesterase I
MLSGRKNPSTVATPRRATGLRLAGFLFAFFAVLMATSSSAVATDTRTLVFFGDSLTAGYGLTNPAIESYPALIQKKLEEERLPWRVVNAGLSGETTSGGLRRIDWILRQPVDIFVLALGANDGLRGISPAVSRSNLQQIVERVRAKNPKAKIVVAGMQMPPAMGEDYTREFGAMFPAVAEKNGATLIPFLLEGVGARPEFNQGDRIHPNAAGHEIMAKHVWTVIRPLLNGSDS